MVEIERREIGEACFWRKLIVIDQELVERVLTELPAGVLSELRATFPGDEDELEQEECPPDRPPPRKQLPLDRHLKELMGDRYDPDSPTFSHLYEGRPSCPAGRRSACASFEE